MSYDARVVANAFLRIARDHHRLLTNMQLQKLVYIAHGYTLAILHEPLVKQDIEAWRYGPVIRDLFDALRKYGSGFVTEFIPVQDRETLSEPQHSIIEAVEDAYSQYSGAQLSTITHEAGTPWANNYDEGSFWNSRPLPERDIETYYVDQLHEQQAGGPV